MTGDVPVGLAGVLDEAEILASAFAAGGHRFFLVGGIVRDACVPPGRPGATPAPGADIDLDATTDAVPERIKELVAPLADALWTQGERFGTIGCRVAGRIYEVTTHRTEVYDEASRKPTVVFGGELRDDLARRDFTVNSIAVDVVERRLADPFDGRGDLARRVLRTPLTPEVAFSEDPLRMLRAARFRAGYDLVPEDALVDAVRAMADRLSIVSAERIRDELQKLLLLDDPTSGLEFLVDTGLMPHVIDELAVPDAVSADRIGARVAAVAREPVARWAALLLDVDGPGRVLRRLRSSRTLEHSVVAMVGAVADLDAGVEPIDPAVRRWVASCRPICPEEALDVARSVAPAGSDGPRSDLDAIGAAITRLRVTEPDLDDPVPLLDGDRVIDLLGIEPGPAVGRAHRWLRELRFDDGPVPPDEAAARLRTWWESSGES